MTHQSENSTPLCINNIQPNCMDDIVQCARDFDDVYLLVLPANVTNDDSINGFAHAIANATDQLGQNATLITIGEPNTLPIIHSTIANAKFQLWISIKRKTVQRDAQASRLPSHHFGALVHTKYEGSLRHCDTRVEYTYCPACDKTTKDYGGKKHTYNSYGTLLSDVWRDIECDLEDDLSQIIERFADLVGLSAYKELRILDCRDLVRESQLVVIREEQQAYQPKQNSFTSLYARTENIGGNLLHGDCLDKLKEIPDNSVDFAFIDPPYNLGKKYNSYSDDMSIQEYFSWCDNWIREIERVLFPGRTVAILNIPLWAIRHFLYMRTILNFQNWIVWDALSYPVRKIMPAHYSIVCFTKGVGRPLPGFVGESGQFDLPTAPKNFTPLSSTQEWYCNRARCVKRRNFPEQTDKGELTDLWWDIHRLKHNSRRVDHPCQLPPHLLYRLISIYTKPHETVLDCFNGAGTTTLAAQQLNRAYIGIELSQKYHEIALSRHEEVDSGLDPFRKVDRKLTEKNSPVARMPSVKYEVPKKTLQLEVRRVAQKISKLPSRDEMILHGKYPIKYYDDYFASWGEVCAAARHDGMSESRKKSGQQHPVLNSANQLSLFNREQ